MTRSMDMAQTKALAIEGASAWHLKWRRNGIVVVQDEM